MSQLLDTLSTPAVLAAMEANFYRGITKLFTTEISQSEIDNPALPLLYATGLSFPLLNGVLRVNFSEEEADQKIAETLEYFKSRDLPMIWFVLPSSQPANLGERLVDHGLVVLEEDTGMECDLTALPDEDVMVPGLEIRRVADETTLHEWIATWLKGFDLPEMLGEVVFKTFMETGFSPDAPMQNFLAYLDVKPVANSTVFFTDGIAAIYDVCTVAEARGKGIGRAITRAPMLWSRDRGYRIAVLEATTMGYPVYQKIGFNENCKIGQYIWMPETTSAT